jgi:transcription antitermination factor NusA-like protein
VPGELAPFVADPQFLQILLKVKEQSKINFITVNKTSDKAADSIMIDAPSAESALLARKLIEIHFKQQLKIMAAENRLHKVQVDLFSAQGEMASGMIVDFRIPVDLVGLTIGKKGARIKQIEKDSGVSSISVDGDSGKLLQFGSQSIARSVRLQYCSLVSWMHRRSSVLVHSIVCRI